MLIIKGRCCFLEVTSFCFIAFQFSSMLKNRFSKTEAGPLLTMIQFFWNLKILDLKFKKIEIRSRTVKSISFNKKFFKYMT